jgi:4-amino-4-deoxy-L-arabinose transferase-like glycosyltransferase
MALIVLPWLIAIGVISHGQFFEASVGEDLLSKVGEGMDAHGAAPGTHLLLFWLTFWPGSLLLAAALPAIWRRRREPAIRFLVSWIVPTFVVFELVATKLPHYTLPTFPAIALLAAAALMAAPVPERRWWVWLLVAVSGLIGVAIVIAVNLALNQSEGAWSPLALGLSVVAAMAALAEIVVAVRGMIRGAAVLLVLEAALVYMAAFGVVIPSMQSLWPSPRLATAADGVAGCAEPQVMSAGYAEASIVFAVGTDIRFGDGAGAADFLSQPGCRSVIVTAAELDAFAARLAEDGGSVGATETIRGTNLRTAKPTTFTVMGAPR